jgi:hypothetical protein
MGISPFNPRSFCSCGASQTVNPPLPEVRGPDPHRFKLGEVRAVGDWLVVGVRYPDTANFEGHKILVFKGVALETLESLEFLDPHFCESAHISPVARFRPTVDGWEAAVAFARLMAEAGL